MGLFISEQTGKERGSSPTSGPICICRPHCGFFHSSRQSSLVVVSGLRGEKEKFRSREQRASQGASSVRVISTLSVTNLQVMLVILSLKKEGIGDLGDSVFPPLPPHDAPQLHLDPRSSAQECPDTHCPSPTALQDTAESLASNAIRGDRLSWHRKPS